MTRAAEWLLAVVEKKFGGDRDLAKNLIHYTTHRWGLPIVSFPLDKLRGAGVDHKHVLALEQRRVVGLEIRTQAVQLTPIP